MTALAARQRRERRELKGWDSWCTMTLTQYDNRLDWVEGTAAGSQQSQSAHEAAERKMSVATGPQILSV